MKSENLAFGGKLQDLPKDLYKETELPGSSVEVHVEDFTAIDDVDRGISIQLIVFMANIKSEVDTQMPW